MLTIGKAYFSIGFTLVSPRRQCGAASVSLRSLASLRGTKQSSRMSKDCFVVPPRNDGKAPRNDVTLTPRNDVTLPTS